MEKTRKQPKKPRIVTKPYLTGSPIDRHLVTDALKIFSAYIGTAILFLVAGALLMMDNMFLRVALNLAAMVVVYAMFYVSGVSKGTAAVNMGEMLYVRKEHGRDVPAKELACCYHPYKGFIVGLLGATPLLICGLLLAFTAQQQLTGLSALPSWISAMEGREEITDALAFYQTTNTMTLETIVRMPIRMALMPLVSIVGSENTAGLLVLERLSALILLIPPVCYGFGYTRGIAARTKVHTSIAANNRKRRKKEKKQQQLRMERKESNQLN